MRWSYPLGVLKLVGVLTFGILVGISAAVALAVGQGSSATAEANQRLLDELVAKDAIREQIYNYGRGLDRMDKNVAYQVWHPDGTANYIDTYEGTGAGFVDWVWPRHEPLVAHSHQITNILIKVDGKTAVSESYVMASLHAQPTENSATTRLVRSRYADVWSKRDGRWAIDRRVAITDFMTTDEATGPNQPTEGRRDQTDPSYQMYPY